MRYGNLGSGRGEKREKKKGCREEEEIKKGEKKEKKEGVGRGSRVRKGEIVDGH